MQLVKISDFRMNFWSVKFSKKPLQKFDKFLTKNLKCGEIIKIKALSFNIVAYMGYL